MDRFNEIRAAAKNTAEEIIETAKLTEGNILVVGCSTSEVMGSKIGTDSNYETATAIYSGIKDACENKGIFIAAQCCEHLNRALIVEGECAEKYGLEAVSVCPQPKAGGSFATAAWLNFEAPVAVEHIRAHAGLDIGGTLVGMHLREVAVPVRLSVSAIGEANILCARTRPKYIGGERAKYTPFEE